MNTCVSTCVRGLSEHKSEPYMGSVFLVFLKLGGKHCVFSVFRHEEPKSLCVFGLCFLVFLKLGWKHSVFIVSVNPDLCFSHVGWALHTLTAHSGLARRASRKLGLTSAYYGTTCTRTVTPHARTRIHASGAPISRLRLTWTFQLQLSMKSSEVPA